MESGAWSRKNSIWPTLMNTSQMPVSMYCGSNQNMDMGTWSLLRAPFALATFSRRISTIAATAMESVDRIWPTPMRWSNVSPLTSPVRLRINGTKNLSYKGKKMQMVAVMNKGMDAAGISKLGPMCRSIVVPWFKNRVPTWANTAENIRLVHQIGSIRTNNFTSSTWVTVHTCQGLGL